MKPQTTSLPTGAKSVQVLAHRGLVSEFVPENTLKAFSDAIAAGADVIETDVQVSKDGVALIFHDTTLLRLAGIKMPIVDFAVAELEEIDIGYGKRIVTLEQALLAFPNTRFNLDIKCEGAIAPTALVIEKLKVHDCVLISSFSESRRLKTLKLLSEPVRTSAGVNKVLKLYLASKLGLTGLFVKIALGSDVLQVPIRKGLLRLDTAKFVQMCKIAKLEIQYWTINSPSEMLRLRELGATGIVTDRCDLAITTLH